MNNKPHFFKVMLHFMLQDGRIYIPTEFEGRHRERLIGMFATLEVASGETWEVELVKNGGDGKIWLANGWGEFAKHQFLKQGDVLVFRLEQDSYFHVMVFDPSTVSERIKCFSHDQVEVEEGFVVGNETGKGEMGGGEEKRRKVWK